MGSSVGGLDPQALKIITDIINRERIRYLIYVPPKKIFHLLTGNSLIKIILNGYKYLIIFIINLVRIFNKTFQFQE